MPVASDPEKVSAAEAQFSPPDLTAFFAKGRYSVRAATTSNDIARAQALRARGFRTGNAVDADDLDSQCDHILIEDHASGALVGCFRTLVLSGKRIGSGYSAKFYGLKRLSTFAGPILEIGRFCVDPGRRDPDILRAAWAAMTSIVDRKGIRLLIGCSSFIGTDPASYRDCFALLKARHLAPGHLQPSVAAGEIYPFARDIDGPPDAKRAMQLMPPLLRSYLTMGGWVSDHAVVDRQMKTLHVFTAVDVGAIPETRKRLLRALA